MRPSFPAGNADFLTRLIRWPYWLWIGMACWTVSAFSAGEEHLPADIWITNAVWYPSPFQSSQIETNLYAGLRAEVLAQRLKVICPVSRSQGATTQRLHVSLGRTGHWPARDWKTYPLNLHGPDAEAVVPVADVDLPLVYFMSATDSANTWVSPMRVCIPRALGLEKPSQLFWSFLEGFEETLESWRQLTPEAIPLRATNLAHIGRSAMVVSIPPGKRSATVATTRLRPWHLWKFNAKGLRIWLRSPNGAGRVRFALHAQARSPEESVSQFPTEFALTETWQAIDLPFERFPHLRINSVDLFSMEFIGHGPLDFLVDDLQLLGISDSGF